MKILECGNDHVVCIKCSQSRKLFATCSNSKVLKIWDTTSFQCCGTRYAHVVLYMYCVFVLKCERKDHSLLVTYLVLVMI